MNKVFFDNAAKAKAEYIIHNRYSQFSNLESFELKNLAVVWCYYSGRIEGNTYSLVETEALIKDDITASKTYSETKMIKNLYNTFISIVETVKHNERVKQFARERERIQLVVAITEICKKRKGENHHIHHCRHYWH